MRMHEIDTEQKLEAAIESGSLKDAVVQGLDLRRHDDRLGEVAVAGAVLLGCSLEPAQIARLVTRGALVFPELPALPYDPYRPRLYDPTELFAGFDPGDPCSYCDTPDARIYRHWQKTGGASPPSILEALARRLHDHAISDALDELLSPYPKVAAIMGGHGMPRGRGDYLTIAEISRALCRRGFLVLSGGGPGAMEATHLGAYFAQRDDAELVEAVDLLAAAPIYRDRGWLAAAFAVRQRFGPEGAAASVGIPTWFYGHEPPNAFAGAIAKYFANSVREDGLVSVATGGIIFAPGSAGTIQEIFQDAAQNHYGTVARRASPMALLGVEYWTETYPVMPLLETLAGERPWARLIAVSDQASDLVEHIASSPIALAEGGWSFCAAHCAERQDAG